MAITTFFPDYYYESKYQIPGSPYHPLFIGKVTNLPHSSEIGIIFGDQIDSHDCLARCFTFIRKVVTGRVDFEKVVGMSYNVNNPQIQHIPRYKIYIAKVFIVC